MALAQARVGRLSSPPQDPTSVSRPDRRVKHPRFYARLVSCDRCASRSHRERSTWVRLCGQFGPLVSCQACQISGRRRPRSGTGRPTVRAQARTSAVLGCGAAGDLADFLAVAFFAVPSLRSSSWRSSSSPSPSWLSSCGRDLLRRCFLGRRLLCGGLPGRRLLGRSLRGQLPARDFPGRRDDSLYDISAYLGHEGPLMQTSAKLHVARLRKRAV